MKKGDIVRCRYKFKFEAVHDNELLTVSIERTAKEKDYILIPLFINGLGFYPPEFDYCLPGSYLPTDHPDYYRQSTDNYFFYANGRYKVSFDQDFMYTGKYYLIPADTEGAPIPKLAAKRTDELRNLAISQSIGQTLDGELIEGRLLEFIVRDKVTKEFLGTGEGLHKGSNNETVVNGFLQDLITGVEFEFPISFLINKP